MLGLGGGLGGGVRVSFFFFFVDWVLFLKRNKKSQIQKQHFNLILSGTLRVT